MEAAGLDPDVSNVKLDDATLLEDWGRLVRELRQIPTRTRVRHRGKFGSNTFDKHFGPWSRIPEAFRQFADGKPEWIDVLPLLPVTIPSVRPWPPRNL